MVGRRRPLADLAGKVVVITGAGSGMGRAYAAAYAARGAVLALGDIDGNALAETVTSLPSGGTVLTEVYDVADRDAVAAFAARVAQEVGPATVVVNNAGIEGGFRPAWHLDDASYDRVMAVNLGGVVHGTRAFLPQLMSRPAAALVNVSSIFGLQGTPNHTDYCASKFAVRGFTEALATELAGSTVSVHLVHPGGVATNISRAEGSQQFAAKYYATSPEAVAERVVRDVESGRMRIVTGHRSRQVAFGARFLPLPLMVRLVRRDMNDILDPGDYAD
ncbi:SDR family oxidoreductase [Rhodococcus sp. BP-332]|nr:SDR family oxidoreductase [Rhodococcus sp. BP-332]